MNFKNFTETLQEYNCLISILIWSIIFIISTWFLLKEIKIQWQKKRIKSGLDDKDNFLCPSKNQKDCYTGFSYKKANRKIFIWGVIVSIIIFLVFFLSYPVKWFSVTNIKEILRTAFYAFIFLSIFTTIGEDIPIENKGNIKILNSMIILVKDIYNSQIKQVVSQEIIYIKTFIKNKIEEIYKDKEVLGCLIVRLNGEFLNGLIDDSTENYEQKKTNIQENCLKLLNLYRKNNPILLDELTQLLQNKLFEYSVPLYEIVEYIRKTEILASTENVKDYIDKHIKDNLEDNRKYKTDKVVSKIDIMEELMNSDIIYDDII